LYTPPVPGGYIEISAFLRDVTSWKYFPEKVFPNGDADAPVPGIPHR
jgi:hypothetical protein